MIKSIHTTERIEPSVFLAGPMYRNNEDISWRIEACRLLHKHGFDGVIYSPEWREGVKPQDWSYEKQIEWEVQALQASALILFWIPRDLDVLPGFTTNVEFGEWLRSGKIVIGSPPKAEKVGYLKERCKQLNISWYHMLEGCTWEVYLRLCKK